jgi:hypothetical protein
MTHIKKEIIDEYNNALNEIEVIVYDYHSHFKREYIKNIYGDIHIPLKIYFFKYIQNIFLGNSISIDNINKIGKRLDKLKYIHNIISNRICNILNNEIKYKIVRKKFYYKIIGYILNQTHNWKSFDKDTLRYYIDFYINNY